MSAFPTRPALIANHFQNENCHPRGRIKSGGFDGNGWHEARLDAARALFAAARGAGVPLIHVRLAVPQDYRGIAPNTAHIRNWMALGAWREGTWGVDFVDGLGPEGDDHVLTHVCNSAFHGTPLTNVLRLFGADEIIVCGVSTAYAVENTVRQAADMGFFVTVASDACATSSLETHERALSAMEPLASILTVEQIVGAFAVAPWREEGV